MRIRLTSIYISFIYLDNGVAPGLSNFYTIPSVLLISTVRCSLAGLEETKTEHKTVTERPLADT